MPVLSITTSSTRCSLNHPINSRRSRLKPPNCLVTLVSVPSFSSIRTVTTCFMRWTSSPATRLCIGSIVSLLGLHSEVEDGGRGGRKCLVPILDTGHFDLPSCKRGLRNNLGCEPARRGPVRQRGKAAKHTATSRPLSSILYHGINSQRLSCSGASREPIMTG